MNKKWTQFLLVVVICLIVETIAVTWCFNSYVNNNKVEKGSVFVNLVKGWDNLTGKAQLETPADINDYVEPFEDHYIYISKDAPTGEIVFGYQIGDKYYLRNEDGMYDEAGNYNEDWEPTPAKDINGNTLLVKAADRYYYATSTNDPSSYMYTKKIGDQYLYASGCNLEAMSNSEGGMVLSGPSTTIPEEDVSFDKDAKFYYMIALGSTALSVSSIIGLTIVSIVGKKKTSLSV